MGKETICGNIQKNINFLTKSLKTKYFEELFREIPLGALLFKSLQSKKIKYNTAAAEFFEIDLNKTFYLVELDKLISKEEKVTLKNLLKEIIEKEKEKSFEIEFLLNSGIKKTGLFIFKPFFDVQSKTYDVLAVFEDISKIKEMEKELKNSYLWLEHAVEKGTRELQVKNKQLRKYIVKNIDTKREFEHFFNLSLNGFLIIGFDGRIKRVNSNFSQITGYEKNHFIGKNIKEIFHKMVHPHDKRKVILAYDKVVTGKPITNLEARFLCKDGSYKWFACTAMPSRKTETVYIVTLDITEKKETEKEMERLEKLNLIGEMAAGIAHEIRNPMTTIRGFLQLMKDKSHLSQKERKYFELMIEEMDRCNSIINEFLSMAKDNPLNLKIMSLNDDLNKLYPLLKADAAESGMDLTMDLHDVKEIPLDEQKIRQLILNLVRNGIEAMSPGGRVTIRTFMEDGCPVLAIQDEGRGIPPDIVDKIDSPFFTTKEKGTGLGLPVCYNIAAKHGAKIEVDTGPNGTIFYVKFNYCNQEKSII